MNPTLPRLLTRPSARRVGALSLAVAALSLGGCAAPGTDASVSTSGVARSWGEAWERVRMSLARGQAYDEAWMAARNNDVGRFERAQSTLKRLDYSFMARRLASQALLSPAEEEVERASQWSAQVQVATNEAQKAQLGQKEAASYRHALELSRQAGGEFNSSNPVLLNALGYFLADKGTSSEDFKRAETLTKRALQLQDQEVQDARQKGGEEDGAYLLARFARANTRDSLAWALFKQAKTDVRGNSQLLEAARQEQQAALDETRHSLSELKALNFASPTLSAELPYHLAMILRAQNVLSPLASREAQVQKLLSESVSLEPDFAPAQQALKP